IVSVKGNPDLEKKYLGGTINGIDTDPEVMGAAANYVREKDAEAEGVFKPERDERHIGWFSPAGEDMAMREAGQTDQSGSPEDDDVKERH
ncbi:hypothetical protein NDU88_006110, partial [Pleurodeles waltl]